MKIRHSIILVILVTILGLAGQACFLVVTAFRIRHEPPISPAMSIDRLERYLGVKLGESGVVLLKHGSDIWWDGTQYEEWTLSYTGDLPSRLSGLGLSKLPAWSKKDYTLPDVGGNIRISRNDEILDGQKLSDDKLTEIRISIWPGTNPAVAKFIRVR
jgi:hypothetical protein